MLDTRSKEELSAEVERLRARLTELEQERRSAEQERNLILERMQSHIERMPLAYLLSDETFCYTHWNPAAERLFGWSRDEVVGKHPFDVVVPPEARPYVTTLFERLRRGEPLVCGTSENITRAGQAIVCEWTSTPLLDAQGRFVGIASMAQDVTERARMQESLRASERRYRTIVETAQEGVWILDAAGRTTFANQRTAAMLGCRVEQLAGRPFLDFVPADEQAAIRMALQRGKGIASPRDLCLCGQDGRKVWVLLSATPLADEAGPSGGSLLMLTDITERRSLEEQFRQSQKMEALGRLAGGVAHDFNNLLTIINGYSELVIASLPQGHPGRPRLQEIHRAGERACRLTRQLLAFSRQMVLEPRVLDLNVFLTESEKLIRRLIGEDIELSCAMPPGLGQVKVDPGHLDQVILNLVVNARDAMPQGGKLTIETANVELDESYTRSHADIQPGPYVLLAVGDTGCGMMPEVKARIFEPFFSTKEPGKGTGLGLATVYGIVKQSGGHIHVYSEPNVGSVFKVYLPRVHEIAAARPSAQGTRVLIHGQETVLIVEDEDAVRALTRHVLQEAGYEVLAASNGSEALQLLQSHASSIDLLVTDVIMPQMSGRQLAETLLERFPSLKVLYVSGYTDDAVLRHGVLRAQVSFLQKPFSPAALTAKVRLVLDGPEEG